jgi:transposase InsO family protein
MLTLMCTATRFPEAIPLRNIRPKTVAKAMVKFFTTFGLPTIVQTDQVSNFNSNLFQETLQNLGIKHVKSTPYQPQSQGALWRFHQTFESMMRTYSITNPQWDEGVPLLLFAARDAVQESLGFPPFQLVIGRSVRGPLKLIKEMWTNDVPQSFF